VRHGSIGGNAGFRFERGVSFNFHFNFLQLASTSNGRADLRRQPASKSTRFVGDVVKLTCFAFSSLRRIAVPSHALKSVGAYLIQRATSSKNGSH